jgi:uracil-DNA glycosylase family 4
MGSRKSELRARSEMIRNCPWCPLALTRTLAVPGEGPLDPPVLLFGQSPGREEDRTGRPFVGRSGQLLEELLRGIGLTREEVFITSILKCHPPKNRPPKRAWVQTCLPHSEAQVALVKPRSLLVLGQVALQGISGFSRLQDARRAPFSWLGVPCFATYHPAAALRFPPLREELRRDFATFRRWLRQQRPMP